MHGRVLSVAGRNELDRASAALLAHLLERRGIKAETLPCQAISLRNLSKLDTSDVRLVCVSYLNPGSVQHARRIVRRLRGKLDRRIPIVVGLWTSDDDGPLPADAPALIGADRLETTLSEARPKSAKCKSSGVRRVDLESPVLNNQGSRKTA